MRNSHPTQLGEMNALIQEIGEKYGANLQQFRDKSIKPDYKDSIGIEDFEFEI